MFGFSVLPRARTLVCALLATPPLLAMVWLQSETATSESVGSSLARLNRSHWQIKCYTSQSAEQWQQIIDEWGGLPPHESVSGGERFSSDTIVWSGNRSQGAPEQAAATTLVYSFPADTVTWGLAIVAPTGPNVLNAELESIFGFGALDLGREHIRQSLAIWEYLTGLRYQQSPDDGAPMDEAVIALQTRGDIRFGAVDLPGSLFAAYNAAPNVNGTVGLGGGDMLINAAQLTPGNLADPTDSFRLLRNVVAHEHGHGLGYLHVVPCLNEKLMEPMMSSLFDGLQTDDIRGGARHYGDRFAGNHTAIDAHHLGDLSDASVRSLREPWLSTNGAAGVNGTGEDWFRFVLTSAQSVDITAQPTGGMYESIEQLFDCFGAVGDPSRDASNAGDLSVELRDAAGAVVLQSSVGGGPGVAETISIALGAGEYTLRVFDIGPNDPQDQVVQTYDLSLRVEGEPFRPRAVPGVDKRIRVANGCYFIGDLHSFANEPGATIVQYDWDLDGDGVFEVTDDPRPLMLYISNGQYDVSLRVTDSNGRTSVESLTVTVFGGALTIDSIAPDRAKMGETAPVVITGTNLKNISSASDVTVLGGGVDVIGTPVPNALGTSVSGLSFQVHSDAVIGLRGVKIQTVDGNQTLANGFGVLAGGKTGDLDGNGFVDGADLAAFLAQWGPCPPQPATCLADFNLSGAVTGFDLSLLLANWD